MKRTIAFCSGLQDVLRRAGGGLWRAGLILLLCGGCMRNTGTVSAPAGQDRPSSADEAFPTGLPAIGKWLLAPDGTPARWLDELVQGKNLREPINVIFVDRAARSAGEATNRLLRALAQAGFTPRHGHSSGYSALIGGIRFSQFPAEKNVAISDAPFGMNNNHGRLFGPFHLDGLYVCTAALSRENVAPMDQLKHVYASFNRARDTLAQRLDQATAFKLTAFVPLDNTLLGRPDVTTGDHDGLAALLEARE